MVRPVALLCMIALLAACSPHAPAPSDATANAAPAPAATNALAGTPMAAYGHALNRAKNVQNVVNDQAKKQAKAIEKATGGN
jgi:hypothetical protein